MENTSALGINFSPQSNVISGAESSSVFWPVIAIIIIAGLIAFIVYKNFLE